MSATDTPLLEVRNLVKHFPIRRGVVIQRQIGAVKAVDNVSFDVRRGETLGLVGETGCGKSTTARLIVRLLDPTSGAILIDGEDIATREGDGLKALHRDMQMIFQDPYSSLNPRKTIGSIIAEPFAIHGLLKGEGQRKQRVRELMDRVGLNPEHYNRYPHEFSGGQRQRIGVARAIALEPKLLVADEPVSALDVSIQAQVLNLLLGLQRDMGLTLIFIAHDLSVVRHMCDRVAVMYLGKVCELAPSDELYGFPRHPYTGALMSAVPVPDPSGGKRQRQLLSGDVPSPANPAAGLPVPHPLPQGPGDLLNRRAGARGQGQRLAGRLPLPPHQRRGESPAPGRARRSRLVGGRLGRRCRRRADHPRAGLLLLSSSST